MSTVGAAPGDAVGTSLARDWTAPAASTPAARVPDPLASLASSMGDAVEELTFMFSENVEQSSRTFEEKVKIDSHHAKKFDSMPVERVHAVVRMLEGSKAYAQVRTMARQFMLAYQRGEAEPERFLLLSNLRPELRYAALRQVLDGLEAGGQQAPPVVSAEYRDLKAEHGGRLQTLFDASAPSPRTARAPADAAQARSEESVLGTLMLKPTVRSVFDAAAGLSEPMHLGGSLHAFQQAGAHLLRRAEGVAMLVIVNNLVAAVRSMLFFAAELEAREREGDDADQRRRNRHLHVRLLLDIAHSSLPSGLVEKLLASLHPGRSPAIRQARPIFLSAMHRQIGLWPDAVFPSLESRSTVREQLLRMQSMSRPGMSVR